MKNKYTRIVQLIAMKFAGLDEHLQQIEPTEAQWDDAQRVLLDLLSEGIIMIDPECVGPGEPADLDLTLRDEWALAGMSLQCALLATILPVLRFPGWVWSRWQDRLRGLALYAVILAIAYLWFRRNS